MVLMAALRAGHSPLGSLHGFHGFGPAPLRSAGALCRRSRRRLRPGRLLRRLRRSFDVGRTVDDGRLARRKPLFRLLRPGHHGLLSLRRGRLGHGRLRSGSGLPLWNLCFPIRRTRHDRLLSLRASLRRRRLRHRLKLAPALLTESPADFIHSLAGRAGYPFRVVRTRRVSLWILIGEHNSRGKRIGPAGLHCAGRTRRSQRGRAHAANHGSRFVFGPALRTINHNFKAPWTYCQSPIIRKGYLYENKKSKQIRRSGLLDTTNALCADKSRMFPQNTTKFPINQAPIGGRPGADCGPFHLDERLRPGRLARK